MRTGSSASLQERSALRTRRCLQPACRRRHWRHSGTTWIQAPQARFGITPPRKDWSSHGLRFRTTTLRNTRHSRLFSIRTAALYTSTRRLRRQPIAQSDFKTTVNPVRPPKWPTIRRISRIPWRLNSCRRKSLGCPIRSAAGPCRRTRQHPSGSTRPHRILPTASTRRWSRLR